MTPELVVLLLILAGLTWAVRTYAPGDREGPRTGPLHVKTFRGSPKKTAEEAAQYQAMIAGEGWVEVTRTYSNGSWGCGAFLLALLLAVVLIGILIFIYLLIVKPAGTLVVTYARAEEPKELDTFDPRVQEKG